MTPEEQLAEAQAAKEAAEAAAEEKSKEAEKHAKALAEANQELEKLRAKEFNFKRLRDMTEEELEKLSEMEKAVLATKEKVEEDSKKLAADRVEFHKRNALLSLSKGDEETMKALEAAYADFAGDAQDQKAIEERALKAWRMVKGPENAPSAITSAFAASGQAAPPEPSKKSFADSDEGKGMASALGLGIAKETK